MTDPMPIAVVGMGGVFPGAGGDLDKFWRNISEGVDATGEIPPDRWVADPEAMIARTPMPDKAFHRRACLIRNFRFNPAGFDLEDSLLSSLDPMHHLALHAGREAYSACGSAQVDPERAGVILAAIALPTEGASRLTRKVLGMEFERMLLERLAPEEARAARDFHPLTVEECLAAKVVSLPAALLARGLGLRGTAFTLDAACASSLYAVKLACDALSAGNADLMLAGGVSRPDCLFTQVGFSQLRALSPSGRCAPFDRSADGLIVGEGAGVLALKRLSDALEHGDTVYAVIRGTGLSNDIGGNLLAPDSAGQVRAMKSAYRAAALSPSDIDLIECHGAGTPVGDLVELRSMSELWGGSGWRRRACAIGSVKSMVGHLLTAAGAAGMIKTILAIRNRTLPPSLKFDSPSDGSPLFDSPFRVQTLAEEWKPRDAGTPLRAAVSAFGFGGINGHIIFEEWRPDAPPPAFPKRHTVQEPCEPVAIVGLGIAAGPLSSLRDFQEAVFRGDPLLSPPPEDRFRVSRETAEARLSGRELPGAYIRELEIEVGEFHIPPNEIPDILPQQLLMLKTAAAALRDAGLFDRRDRTGLGCVIGISFDMEAANFHLRWALNEKGEEWIERFAPHLESAERAEWIAAVKNAAGPPLTPARTVGALGGIVASRIAKEFRFGAPSFVVSQEEASGLKALEVGATLLRQDAAEALLIGGIDMAGDFRTLLITDAMKPWSPSGRIRPFDVWADGALPGEGAAALVIKRLDRALRDGDRIYAVVRGIGNASGGGIGPNGPDGEVYRRSLSRALGESGIPASRIGCIEASGSGYPAEDRVESEAILDLLSGSGVSSCAIGSVKPVTGDAGAASGLFGLVKAVLSLYQEIIPPLPGFERPEHPSWKEGRFHFPAFPQYWARDRRDGPRAACVASMTRDGSSAHVILEAYEPAGENRPAAVRIAQERLNPLGLPAPGIFPIEADSERALLERLEALSAHLSSNMELPPGEIARRWHEARKPSPEKRLAVCLFAGDAPGLAEALRQARDAVERGEARKPNGHGGVAYSPEPLGRKGETAFVFPGSGAHYVGMGRDIAARWPEIPREIDRKTPTLKSEMIPAYYVPRRTSWEPGWEGEAHTRLVSDPLHLIFGQVVHGGLVSDLLRAFGVSPQAVIGYSLGESAGLFALGAWSDRSGMLERMRKADLFTSQLSGPCLSLRKAWNLPADAPFEWSAAVVNRPADSVRTVLDRFRLARLLIVNTPEECVVGGDKGEIETLVRTLGCDAIFLEGVVTVHCDAAVPVAGAYRALHLFPVDPTPGIRFYSCSSRCAYPLTSDAAADSILSQAVSGFDFPATIDRAYRDGVRVFIEAGPQATCTRMIGRILEARPHLAVSASLRGEAETTTIYRLLSTLIAERVGVDLAPLFAGRGPQPEIRAKREAIVLSPGGPVPASPLPPLPKKKPEPVSSVTRTAAPPRFAAAKGAPFPFLDLDILEGLNRSSEMTARAHESFLAFSEETTRSFAEAFSIQTRLLERIIGAGEAPPDVVSIPEDGDVLPGAPSHLVSREQCIEFAVGSAAAVLGPEFSEVDTFKTRVRLPDAPLMLVDRILSVEGEKGSLGPGRVVTEHDVLPGAWYLDGGHAPVCISVEAGQADLFLCAWLGIDLAVRGKRAYRLLDAVVEFQRGLPVPGETIRYHIEIERFARQGETYLFFFRFTGYIGETLLIRMSEGCAGFFTPEEVERSGGILVTADDLAPLPGKRGEGWKPLVPLAVESYPEESLAALRKGDAAGCFGPAFEGIRLSESIRLPAGRMRLIDRVLRLDPEGGRYGLGLIVGEADIHHDDWFLTCHFKDDMVMPGTLMYECCAHTLRVFLQRIGWVTEREGVFYAPVEGVRSRLKCRGPVTPETRKVVYEIEIKEIGYAPEPYALADAHMYADGRRIVMFRNMSMKMAGIGREEIASFWENRKKAAETANTPIFGRDHILAFALGNPSEAFGEPYRIFDSERKIARLPAPPYSFIDRITRIEPEPWVLKPGGWVEAEYDVPPDAWYFRANRSSEIPFCVLLEIALQPCGWLAAYAGSALRSERALRFRNLGGKGTLLGIVGRDAGTLTMRSRMTRVSEAAEMLIEHFDFEILRRGKAVYKGETYFGFFSEEALSNQVGIRDAAERAWTSAPVIPPAGGCFRFAPEAPISPEDPDAAPEAFDPPLAMPAKALLMVDEIDAFDPEGGPARLGFIRGRKTVDPKEWFFAAHFYQDPVCPGSLGIESFIQLLRYAAMERWRHHAERSRFSLLRGKPHAWTYRGQIVQSNREIGIEAAVTRIQDIPVPTLEANGFLRVDGRYIYEMKDFGLQLIDGPESP